MNKNKTQEKSDYVLRFGKSEMKRLVELLDRGRAYCDLHSYRDTEKMEKLYEEVINQLSQEGLDI